MAHAYTAFDGPTRVARGALLDVALAVKHHQQTHPESLVIIFDAVTSQAVDVLLQGDDADVAAWIEQHYPQAAPKPAGRGRPRLGVVSREVSLLPRQWEWLSAQAGGASVTLRKLVDQAARDPAAEQRAARDAAYRFAHAVAGNEPGFEEAMRALYAADQPGFEAHTALWPDDVRDHTRELAVRSW